MTEVCWKQAWFAEGLTQLSMTAWRGVDAQHVVSSMRLVDTLDEQAVLESLLEGSKPVTPAMKSPQHYLIYTPFRYRPQHPSRFRRSHERGLWYGAETIFAACAEVAYWRHRFVLDSAGLTPTDVLTEHTFFQANIAGLALDLMSEPWVGARPLWTHGSDYTHTQAVAEAARTHEVQWIAYESVRAPGHRCAAVLDVDALEIKNQGMNQQTWHCKANRESVMLVHGQDRFVWQF